jgi:hypothetical protein
MNAQIATRFFTQNCQIMLNYSVPKMASTP